MFPGIASRGGGGNSPSPSIGLVLPDVTEESEGTPSTFSSGLGSLVRLSFDDTDTFCSAVSCFTLLSSESTFGEFWISFVKSSTVGIFEAKASEILVFSFLRTNRINPTTIRKENMVI